MSLRGAGIHHDQPRTVADRPTGPTIPCQVGGCANEIESSIETRDGLARLRVCGPCRERWVASGWRVVGVVAR